MPKILTLVGERYRKLTVLAKAGKRGGYVLWECACDCGNTTFVTTGNLRNATGTQSCGCAVVEHLLRINKTHGMTGTPTYTSWLKMRERCRDKKSNEYQNYGGRGITVCDRWEMFENFLADMGERPRGTSIERKDNNSGYCPDNCVWADSFEQQRNTRKSVVAELHGEDARLVDICRESGLPYSTVYKRWRKGWRGEKLMAAKLTWKTLTC